MSTLPPTSPPDGAPRRTPAPTLPVETVSAAGADGTAAREASAADVAHGRDPVTGLDDGDGDGHLLTGHRYDGIKEYDNPMPRWWVAMFWLTIVFSPLYVLAVHTFGWLPDYTAHLAGQTEDLESVRAAYASANPAFADDPETLATFAANPDNAAAGAATYTAVCAACHGDKGQGLIGPNLTDDYWLHGGAPGEIYAVLKHGVVEKGMPAWEGPLSDEERGQLVAFIASIHGTNPAGAKEPQGEKVGG